MAKVNMTLEEKLNDAIVKDGPYEVPGNWVSVKLNSIFKFEKGKKPKTLSEEYVDNSIPYVTINYFQTKEAKQYTFKTETNRICKEEDVLIVWDGARAGLIGTGVSGALGSTLCRIKCEGVNKKYIYYYFSSKYDSINSNTKGTGIPHVDPSYLETLNIGIPPLKEQKRIVDRIDSLFEKLDKAKELIEEAREGFENRKAAILEMAFRGELTNISNTNSKEETLGNNDIAFDIFNSRYKLSSLDNIIEEKPRNGYSPKAVEYETSTKTLKLGAITRGYFNENEFKYIDEVINKDSHLWLKNGDFLIQRANSLEYVGISAIYNMEDDIFVYPDLIMKFRVKKDIYNAKLLWYWINSRYGRWYFINNATGTAGNMPKINQKVVMNLPIPVIPFNEQQIIVKILDKFLEEESKIEELTQLEEQIELMKKSILAKAFRGGLGTNCEEDESVLELLKEILSKN